MFKFINKTTTHTWKISLILALVLGLLFVAAAQAQDSTAAGATIQQINTANFPEISFFLEAFDDQGNALSGLSEGDIRIVENDLDPLSIDLLQQNEPGYQVILAYNLAPGLANSTITGISRYQAITDHILEWLDSRPSNTPDDFSLATDTGLQEIRRADPREFAQDLRDYRPDLMNSQPNLTSLLQALDLATDPNLNPLMKRAILYITPQPNLSNISAFSGFIDRAIQQNVPVYVWMVGPASARVSNPSVVEPLVELAEKTGGQFFLFSGQEELPDIEDYFRANRFVYQVTYTSAIKSSGFQRIRTLISQREQEIVSNVETVRLVVQPPNPILITPPLLVDRIWLVDKRDARIRDLEPDQVEIEYMYEFPDGYPRDLTSARLYVNGEVFQEVDREPFNRFVFDLTPYETDQEILFLIEIEDSQGIIARTQPTVMKITVEPVPLTFWEGLMRLELTPERWIILASVLVAGMVLVVAIILVGKRKSFWKEQSAARNRRTDPVTQPVKIKQEGTQSRKDESQKYQSTGKQVDAMLVPINDRFEPNRQKTIALDKKEWIIGSDPQQSRLVIANSALDSVHARLVRRSQGDYWLSDQNSIAGTWVNFTPITTKGVKLRHGDLIHFAKAIYRFELTHPTEDREIQIITYNQKYDS